MKRLLGQHTSASKPVVTSESAVGGLPPLTEIKPLSELADAIRDKVQLRWLSSSGGSGGWLSDAYDRYLESMGTEYSPGNGRLLLAVYGGNPLSLRDSSGEPFMLERNSIAGHLLCKRSDALPADVLSAALAWRARGVHPREVYGKLRDSVPLDWNLVDSLPEASQSESAAGFLALVNVHPSLRRIGLSSQLMGEALRSFLDVDGLGYAFAFARALGFRQSGEPDIQEYVLRRDSAGLHPDLGIRIHQNVGQKVLCGVPKGAVDSASAGYAVLMASNLRQLRSAAVI